MSHAATCCPGCRSLLEELCRQLGVNVPGSSPSVPVVPVIVVSGAVTDLEDAIAESVDERPKDAEGHRLDSKGERIRSLAAYTQKVRDDLRVHPDKIPELAARRRKRLLESKPVIARDTPPVVHRDVKPENVPSPASVARTIPRPPDFEAERKHRAELEQVYRCLDDRERHQLDAAAIAGVPELAQGSNPIQQLTHANRVLTRRNVLLEEHLRKATRS